MAKNEQIQGTPVEIEEFDGSLMPNDGGVFQPQPTEEVQKEIAKERDMIKAGAPLLDWIFAFLDEQIAYTGDITSINLDSDDLKAELKAQRMLADRLYALKSSLENLSEAHLDKS